MLFPNSALVDATLQTKPEGSTHWSCRTMAAVQGMSKSTVNTVWRSHNIKPHRSETFKLSRDPKFLEKLTDVVGLYLNPVRSRNSKSLSCGQFCDRFCEWRRRIGCGCWAM
jgi:hypothetical protein